MSEDFPLTEQGFSAPTASELAALAIQLFGGDYVMKHPDEAMKAAAKVWIAARCRCERVEWADGYRLAALVDIEDKPPGGGEMTQEEVIAMEGVPKSKQFHARARKFYGLDWRKFGLSEDAPGPRCRLISFLAASRGDLAFLAWAAGDSKARRKAGDKRPPVWRREVAEAFVEWLIWLKSDAGRKAGRALHAKSGNALTIGGNPLGKLDVPGKSADQNLKPAD